MRCTIVSHTHWDREWYRTFQSFRARLVDTVDAVLDLAAADPGYRFQLDGQSIAIEDYLEIRPEREAELSAACQAGRIAIGPWYVQPDSLLPSGEAHIRNLLEGRRVAERFGPCCRIAYTPDSFGHPAQFPQLFAGFGLEPFVYWRGNANEIEELSNEWLWRAPDGSEIRCVHLAKGYFNSWGLSADLDSAVKRVKRMALDLRETSRQDSVLLMNGIDHMLPDPHTREVAEALAKETGWEIQRGLLDDFVDSVDWSDLESFSGELVGGRVAPLLPGVWSTRSALKLDNRHCEATLEGWAEPWSSVGSLFGTPDDRPALRSAWRNLLANQAHDSICGCSKDRVHDQMQARYDASSELANETTLRVLERLAGLPPSRQVVAASDSDDGALEIAIFNPSPRPSTDLVRLPLDGFPSFTSSGIAPLLAANLGDPGFRIDDRPARLIPLEQNARPRPVPGPGLYDVEFVAEDVPAMGWRRMTLRRDTPHPDEIDEGRMIEANSNRVEVADDGSLDVTLGGRLHCGLTRLEDVGDRGDSYDFDGVPGETSGSKGWPPERVAVTRRRHASGIQELEIERWLRVPSALAPARDARSDVRAEVRITTRVRIAPGIERLDLEVEIDNQARDHRLRMLFPTGAECSRFRAATTFDATTRSTSPRDGSKWIHPAPSTFCQQGWVQANGLAVIAPGLNEAEVDPAGVIAITLIRAVGWLSRPDLSSRSGEAGPTLATPGSQCIGVTRARLSLLAVDSPDRARDLPSTARAIELGLRAVPAGPTPLLDEGHSMLRVEPRGLVLSCMKPAESGEGVVVRLLNPGDTDTTAHLELGFDIVAARSVRLDETPISEIETLGARRLELPVPAHALRSVWIRSASEVGE